MGNWDVRSCRDTRSMRVCSSGGGRHIVAAWLAKVGVEIPDEEDDGDDANNQGEDQCLVVAVYDVQDMTIVSEACISSSAAVNRMQEDDYDDDDEEILPVSAPHVVSVLQSAQGKSKAAWMLIAIGCSNGHCVLVRHSLVMGRNQTEAQWVPLEKLLAPYQSSLRVLVSTIAAGKHHATAFAFLPNSFLAIAHAKGGVQIRRLRMHNDFVQHGVVVIPDAQENMPPISTLAFGSRYRLLCGRTGHRDGSNLLQLILLSEVNDQLSAHAVPDKSVELGGSQELLGVLRTLEGTVAYAALDRTSGAVFVWREADTEDFAFGPPHAVINAFRGAGAAANVVAHWLDVKPDMSTVFRSVSRDGVLVAVEALGRTALFMCEVIRAGRAALAFPLSKSFLEKAYTLGLLSAPLAVAEADDVDHCAQLMMALCVEHGGVPVLQDLLNADGSPGAPLLMQWASRYGQEELARVRLLVQGYWRQVDAGEFVARPESGVVTAARIELAWSRLGSLYRLQESLAIAGRGHSEEVRVSLEHAASRTMAQAQQLEILAWLVDGRVYGVELPVKDIAAASRAQREVLLRAHQFGPAVAKELLFIDRLWHAMQAGTMSAPDGTHEWPPVGGFRAILDAVLLVPGNVPVPLVVKQAVLLYALLDAAWADKTQQTKWGGFCQYVCMPKDVERRVRALWMIDRRVDMENAAEELASVGIGASLDVVGGRELGVLAVSRFLYAGAPLLALNVLQRVPRPNTGLEIDVFVATYVACGLFSEALLLCREMHTEHSIAPLERLFARCDRDQMLGKLLVLPLNSIEEEVLFNFVGAIASVSAPRDNRDKLVLYLLLRGRLLEATSLWGKVKERIATVRPGDAQKVDQLIVSASGSCPPSMLTGVLPYESLSRPPLSFLSAAMEEDE